MASSAASRLKPRPRALGLEPARRSLAGFLICGILLSFPAAMLPVWGYDLKADLSEVGEYFLTLCAGFFLAQAIARLLFSRRQLRFTFFLANGLASFGFLLLAFWPPAAAALGMAGVLVLGVSAGLLTSCVLRCVSALYESDPRGSVNLASVLLGFGCFLTALLVATFYLYSVRGILIVLAILPILYAGFTAKPNFGPSFAFAPTQIPNALRYLNKPSVVLLCLLLFFQFGNEWSVAGWLPLFLIRRLGISPEGSLLLLAFYWATLVIARIAVQVLRRRISHTLMLAGSVLSSLLGALVLTYTNNRFGAIMGILFVGAGFASVLPLALEKTKCRFENHDLGLLEALIWLSVAGAFLVPWLLGYPAEWWGIDVVMIAPLVGTCFVLVLIWLIMLEAKLSDSAPAL